MILKNLTRNAASIAVVAVVTLIVRIPVPATQGYINLGDAAIIVCALLWGPRSGGVAGGVGSALADVMGGYAHWAPFTLVIKGIEGLLVGLLGGGNPSTVRAISAATLGGAAMVAGYFATETWLYGWQPAVLAGWANGLQALAGVVVGTGATYLLRRGKVPSDPA